MKIAALIARYLLGFIFFVFGLNGFLHFIKLPLPGGVAGDFMKAMFVTHYLVPVYLIQLIGGVLLLANRYVPLALTLLAPVIVNIVLFHLLMAPDGLPLASVVTILWIVVALHVRSAFAGILQAKV